MKVVQDTISFHPQSDEIKKFYAKSKEARNEKYKGFFKELGINKEEETVPRPLVYFLPTGNKEFDEGIDAATPEKTPEGSTIHGGGLPVGRLTIIHGKSGVGKSQFMYNLCCNADFRTLYIDTEGSIVDKLCDNVFVYNTELVEDCWEVVFKAIDNGRFNCIVIDSLTNLKTREDMQKDDGEMPRMGQRAQVVGSFLTKLTAKMMKNDVAVVIISQERESLDMFKKDPVLPGGASVLYSVSLILGLLSNKADEIKDKETGLKIGQKTRVKIRKNRFGPSNCEFICKIMFAKGANNGKK